VLVASLWSRLALEDRRFLILTPDYERALHWQGRLLVCGIPKGCLKVLGTSQGSLYDDALPERSALSDRAGALSSLAFGDPSIVIAPVSFALEVCLSPKEFRQATLWVRKGDEVSPASLIKRLSASGYEWEEPVRRPGTYSLRGGILDLFPAGAELPTRMEFFGDVVESLRWFDPETQRSLVERPSEDHPEREFGEAEGGERGRGVLRIPPFRPYVYPEAVSDVAELVERWLENRDGEGTSSKKVFRGSFREGKRPEGLDADLQALRDRVFFDRLEHYLPFILSERACVLDYAREGGVWVVLDEPVELEVRAEQSVEGLSEALRDRYSRGEVVSEDARDYFCSLEGVGGMERVLAFSDFDVPPKWFPPDGIEDVRIKSLTPYRAHPRGLTAVLPRWRESLSLYVATDQPTRARSLLAQLGTEVSEEVPPSVGFSGGKGVFLLEGNLAGGFIHELEGFVVLTDAELFGSGRLRLPQRRFSEGVPLVSVFDLKPGDYVVHVHFGIGIYRGLVTRVVDGIPREYLKVDYKPPDTLLVPTDQLDRLQKYLTPSDAPPEIHSLSGKHWHHQVRKARQGAEAYARQLIQIYARRAQAHRPPYGEDTPWQKEMEATFPWVETPSQLAAIRDVKRDLSLPQPMDRLVCGDVGFGKTEVAVRAAFKVVQAGKQVAVLAPTTVLTEQHYRTFSERLSGYPVRIGVLNRLRKPRERAQVLQGLKDGTVDIVIGTHALLESRVHFHDLGLLIIDEEQRFGVRHKERLKALRASVDVLTLTATPIPRTLNMALMHIRPMSLINDPPPGRLPIRTYLKPYGEGLVKEALLRELARGGQAFYVYNKVQGISHVVEKVRRLVPQARVAMAHGQMKPSDLEDVMLAFYNGEVDVLVCTTIIENGIDNPNVNTLIVENADRFGLAQLYQLRGRVGRSDRQAYAYFLYRPGKQLTEGALQRLKALQEFSELGSGYALAFRDLQIRGAGELLGAKQHGLMHSVGYEMYVQLIHEAVAQLKEALDQGGEDAVRWARLEVGTPVLSELPPADIPLEAYIPQTYIADQSQRLYYYKRIMEARSEDALKDLGEELRDRYGPVPVVVQNALHLMSLRIKAKGLGVRKIKFSAGHLVINLQRSHLLTPVEQTHLRSELRGSRVSAESIAWEVSSDLLAALRHVLQALEDCRLQMPAPA
jgi:transcription-repair coupling factor (superfamily II helicase)